MILFHGTYTDFQAIELGKCHPYKDFGKGFYLTDIEGQAIKMAEKKSRIFKGTPVVLQYEFDENTLSYNELKVKQFTKPDQEWAEFVFNNRSRTSNFSHDFDIVTGPIADDGVAYLLDRYEEGTLSIEQLANLLQFRDLNKQYFFGTSRALKYLKRL